jgi:hypothetical protein
VGEHPLLSSGQKQDQLDWEQWGLGVSNTGHPSVWTGDNKRVKNLTLENEKSKSVGEKEKQGE